MARILAFETFEVFAYRNDIDNHAWLIGEDLEKYLKEEKRENEEKGKTEVS